MPTLIELLADLDAEYDDLRSVVEDLTDDAPEWDVITPAEGWAVRDQISHLAFFDDAARMAMVDPEAFAGLVDQVMASEGDPMDVHLVPGRAMGGHALLEWWEAAHRGMVEAFAVADPQARVPWFGPPMGVLSFLSARLMETWAHGQDVCDALDEERVATARLFHIAHLGVRARPFSYAVRGREVPTGRIHVAVTSPDGEAWIWEIGEAEGDAPVAMVTGNALDFCLAVVHRRNIADTDLVVTGDLAQDWMAIAQAFAGPPGPGRPRT
jgi:uncharacterized protein (TIGR03084 family)